MERKDYKDVDLVSAREITARSKTEKSESWKEKVQSENVVPQETLDAPGH